MAILNSLLTAKLLNRWFYFFSEFAVFVPPSQMQWHHKLWNGIPIRALLIFALQVQGLFSGQEITKKHKNS